MTGGSARAAIVTGAIGGTGAAVARRLAADEMAVAVVDLDESAAKGTANCIAAGCIVSDMTKATAARIGEDCDSFVAKRAGGPKA